MKPEQKVSLVEMARDTYGLNCALATVELAKSTWYYHQNEKVDYEEKHAELRAVLETIARKHPEYGLPRIMVELRDVYHCQANHKVVEKLLGLWDLRILRGTRQRAPSGVQKAIREAGDYANVVAQMDQIGLFQVLYTDFTELVYADGQRKAVLMPIIGHVSKMAFGWAVNERADTAMALQAWERCKETFQILGISHAGMVMHHDRDPVYTGYEWISQLLLKDELRLSYALRGAKDNPEMESFHGRFKTEGNSLFLGAQTIGDLITIVGERMEYYNRERRHSSIDYLPPLTYIKGKRSKEA
jgi:transposase InsO family protein